MTLHKQYVVDVKTDGASRRLTFKLSTGTLDRDRDRIAPEGWDLTQYLKNPVVLWAHDYRSLPIAKTVDIRAGGDALRATAEFATHEFAEDVFQLYRGGFLSAVSVGFVPIEQEANAEGGHNIVRAELLEFSGVPVPSNPEALLIAEAKRLRGAASPMFDSPTPPQEKGVIGYRRTPLAPESTPWDAGSEIAAASVDDLKIMCTYFFGDGTKKGDFKLPHHHASGNHACVWRGVANAAARLSQTSLPAGDIPGVKKHLAGHYKDFGKEPPWKAAPERWEQFERAAYALKANSEITDARLAQLLSAHGFADEADAVLETGDPIAAERALLALDELLDGLEPLDPLDDPQLLATAVSAEVGRAVDAALRRARGRLD